MNYTQASQVALQAAIEKTKAVGNTYVEGIHLLHGILQAGKDNIAIQLLKACKVNIKTLTEDVASHIQQLPSVSGATPSDPQLSRSMYSAMQYAREAANTSGDTFISIELLLLGLAKDSEDVIKILSKQNITYDILLEKLPKVKPSHISNDNPDESTDALKKFGIDITERAKAGTLDPVIGRDGEIRRVLQVLTRRTKNNPVLIGEPGVGKTAVVEGIANRIVSGDVPVSLKNKKIISLDIGAILAGAKYQGEFEERFKAVLKEISESHREIITFIDELHTIVGTGKSQSSALDAGNLLKPMLARGELRMIGATTLDEYRENIEKDAALERRFQQVLVTEPSVDDTIAILRGLKEKYEAHHEVSISDAALVSAANLSNRYITNRFLPDKAIDLVDEAASRLRLEIDSAPDEIDELQRKVDRMHMEEIALADETDPASKERLAAIQAELQNDNVALEKLKEEWKASKESLNRIGLIAKEIDRVKSEAERAKRDGDLETASRIEYAELPKLEEEQQRAREEVLEKKALIDDEVTAENIAAVVEAWTGVPVQKLLSTDREKLLHLESVIGQHVIGQRQAIREVSDAIRRSRAGISDPKRPTGSFLFLGPTGVGKTELAKVLAETLFDSEKALIRIDMSEYSEKHSVARLVGAPPGYVGYEEGGQLTEAIRRRPYSVILLDEIEKAHAEVFDILLQVLDDGRLTDGQGRVVNFANTIIILTSNLASDVLMNNEQASEEKRKAVMEVVRTFFRPEFLNRLDDIILFDALTKEDLGSIIALHINELTKRLADRRITLSVSDVAIAWLQKHGYDAAFGARPMKRLVQNEIGDKLAYGILDGSIPDGTHIHIDRDAKNDGRLHITSPQKHDATQREQDTKLQKIQNNQSNNKRTA